MLLAGRVRAEPGTLSVVQGEIKAAELLAAQYVSSAKALDAARIEHPIPDYPDTAFTWDACAAGNPYLIVKVRDQQVPLVTPGSPVNETVLAFAISTWAEIAYTDPSVTSLMFHIAEDLIYDINNDTFAVATPFDVKGGDQQEAGISAIGAAGSTSISHQPYTSTESTLTYNIKFTFMSSPLASQVASYQPSEGVQRISAGQFGDSDGQAFAAFSDLIARLYFNLVTAALGNACNSGCFSGAWRLLVNLPHSLLSVSMHACRYGDLIPVAAFVQNRLRRLAPGAAVYNGIPLFESLVLDGHDRLCIKETNTLYLVSIFHCNYRNTVVARACKVCHTVSFFCACRPER